MLITSYVNFTSGMPGKMKLPEMFCSRSQYQYLVDCYYAETYTQQESLGDSQARSPSRLHEDMTSIRSTWCSVRSIWGEGKGNGAESGLVYPFQLNELFKRHVFIAIPGRRHVVFANVLVGIFEKTAG